MLACVVGVGDISGKYVSGSINLFLEGPLSKHIYLLILDR